MNTKLLFLDDQYRLRNNLYLNCVKELNKVTDFQTVTITNSSSAGTLTAQNNFIIALIEKLLTGYTKLDKLHIKETVLSPLKPTTNNQRYKTQQGNSHRFTYGNSKKGQTTL